MFYLLCGVLLAISPAISISQENQQLNKNPNDINFTFTTEQLPFYPQGDISLYTYFYENIKYSEEALAAKISGEVMMSFYVMPDSTLDEIMVLSGVGYGIDDEVTRVLKPLKYAPGIISGEKAKMNVILYVPVIAH